ncbi:MAG: hypothetical protein MUE98_14100 [Rhodobacteraceae bacterium]|jgi:hypothetical protein|nr:hypothetical protein [Paracoccaceae bacterium]
MTMTLTHAPSGPAREPLLPRLMADEPRFTLLGLVLGLALIPVFAAMAIDGRLYQDVNVWVKPAKFLASLSLYALNLALFARLLPPGMTARRSYRAFSWVVVFCILAEIAWIGGAAANGTGSHFNVATPAMELIYSLMGLFAVTLTAASLVYGIAILRHPAAPVAPTLRLAVGLGLVLTFALTVPVAGYMASAPGHFVGQPQTGALLPVLGWSREVGDLRVAHFLATHAMQVVPLLALAALALGRGATVGVWAIAAGYAVLTLATFAQALAGQPFLPWLG